MSKELALTNKFVELLTSPHYPTSANLWELINVKPIPPCPIEFEKKAGAKADACFLKTNDIVLLLENKAYDAKLQPRQELFYLNHFMHFIANHGLAFREYKLVFITREGSAYQKHLQSLFTAKYRFPISSIEKSHLSHAEILHDGCTKSDGSISYYVRGTYKNVCADMKLNVFVIGVDVSFYENV